MRTSLRLALVAGLIVAALPGPVSASENIIKFFERNASAYATQGEWAVYLVKALGKDGDVPTGATQLDFIALLEKNRIQPLGGWSNSEFLSFGAKAVTMVQALALEELLPPDAAEADYVWLLESLGFHEGSPTELVRVSEALNRNINDPVFQEQAGNQFHINITRYAPGSDGSRRR